MIKNMAMPKKQKKNKNTVNYFEHSDMHAMWKKRDRVNYKDWYDPLGYVNSRKPALNREMTCQYIFFFFLGQIEKCG